MGYIEKTKAVLATLTAERASRATRATLSLEEVLAEILRHGAPSMYGYPQGSMHAGWRCKCDLYVAAKGLSAAISSDWKMATPLDAAIDCLEKIIAAKKSMGGGS